MPTPNCLPKATHRKSLLGKHTEDVDWVNLGWVLRNSYYCLNLHKWLWCSVRGQITALSTCPDSGRRLWKSISDVCLACPKAKPKRMSCTFWPCFIGFPFPIRHNFLSPYYCWPVKKDQKREEDTPPKKSMLIGEKAHKNKGSLIFVLLENLCFSLM